MPAEIYLVKVGMSMTEGIVEQWYVPDGGSVATGDLLYRLETEKVNLDIDAEESGTVRHLVEEGVTMNPGDLVGYIYLPGETVPDTLPGAGVGTAAAQAPTGNPVSIRNNAEVEVGLPGTGRLRASPFVRRLAAEQNIDLTALNGSGPGGRIVESDVSSARSPTGEPSGASPSSPLARKVARELGLDLKTISGTGPGGRITRQDVERESQSGETSPAASRSAPPSPGPTANIDLTNQATTLPLTSMRRTIGSRMLQSLQSSAQLTMDMDAVMDEAVRLRTQLIEEWAPEGIRPTYTDLVIRAAAKALCAHPLMNSSLMESEILLHNDIHLGMAVALNDGLVVPVVRHANTLDMRTLCEKTARLSESARSGSLNLDEFQGGTFTVSALGMFGVDSFTPIINPPQSGILGVNRIREDTGWEGDKPVKRHVMRLSLTWDHRVLDGAPAAQFLAEVRDLLEAPYRLLV